MLWANYGEDGSDFGVYHKVFDSDGSVLRGETLVSTVTAGD